jgi:exosortase
LWTTSLTPTRSSSQVRERDRLWPDRGAPLVQAPWLAAAAFVVVALAAAPLVPELVHVWRTNPYAGHGMFVPVYAAFLAWVDRDRLRSLPRRGEPAGALVLLLGLAAYAAARSAQSLAFQVIGLTVALAGAVVLAYGVAVARALAVPLGFLVLMLPLPAAVVSRVTLPIQTLAARFASAVLGLAGVPHFQHGIYLELPRVQLYVAEGCNGLRFLMALVTLTAALAQATQRTAGRKAILIAAAIPLAIVANDVRIAVIALAGHYVGPEAATGLTHHSIGKGVWALTLLPLVLLALRLRKRQAA